MGAELVALVVCGVVSVITLALLIVCLVKINALSKGKGDTEIVTEVQNILLREFKGSREELASSLKDNRTEFSDSLNKLSLRVENKLDQNSESMNKNARENREDLINGLKNFGEVFSTNVKEFNELQRQKFDQMTQRQEDLVKTTEEKLEKMRETVDEKLHKTLEERLGQSFKLVSERLEAVQKGLGEMQTLASGVGDLKKVLSNVKTRGVLGEIQLGSILEEIMAPDQYEANVRTKVGSNDLVEFAVKLPAKDGEGGSIYLPIDAKFPQEDYLRLQDAYENGDKEGAEGAKKALASSIRKFAKDIYTKYIDPPHTTDFGIMFLPIEGLFAEVVRQPDLLAELQREYKIIATGPTTLAAILNSLQMGFKTLAIQKRTSEVWRVLGSVKTEFGKFGDVLAKAQKKINEANKELDDLVGKRTRQIIRNLKKVEQLPTDSETPVIGEE